MSVFIIGIGVALAAIGIVLTTNGLVIYQSTFGNAMAIVGGVALVGGLVLVTLGFIYRVLLQISEKLDGAMVAYEAEEEAEPASPEPTALPPFIQPHHAPAQPPHAQPSHAHAPEPAPPRREPPRVVERPAPATAPAPEPVIAPPLRPRAAPAPAPAPVSLEPAISEPVQEEPAPAPAAEPREHHGLPSWFRRNREPVPPPPPVATRNFQLGDADEPVDTRSGRGSYRDEPREDDFPSVVKSGPFNFDVASRDEPAPGDEREEPAFAPILPRREEEAPRTHEPAARPPASHQPAPPRAPAMRAEPGEEEADPGQPPAFLRPGPSAASPAAAPPAPPASAPPVGPPAPAPAPAPAAAEGRQPTVLKSGFIGGMAYTLYSDGSIEAELPDGTLRFASLQELREHVAATSQGGG